MGIEFNGNIGNLFGAFAPKEAQKSSETKELSQPVPVGQNEKTAEADSLKGLAVQGQASIQKTLYQEDIRQCKELAEAFFPGNAEKISKYLTPLNVASTTKTTKEGLQTIGDAITQSHMETLIPEIEKALNEFFA